MCNDQEFETLSIGIALTCLGKDQNLWLGGCGVFQMLGKVKRFYLVYYRKWLKSLEWSNVRFGTCKCNRKLSGFLSLMNMQIEEMIWVFNSHLILTGWCLKDCIHVAVISLPISSPLSISAMSYWLNSWQFSPCSGSRGHGNMDESGSAEAH